MATLRVAVVTLALSIPFVAGAQSPSDSPQAEPATTPPAAEAPAPAKAPPAPYSLPWQLRPAAAGSVVRSDTAVAFYSDAAGNGGSTVATMLLVAYKVMPNFAPLVRLGLVGNSPPGAAQGGTTLVNPAVGGTYAMKLTPDLRLGLFLGLTIPVGQGGGNDRDPVQAATTASGILARSAMDNAMFAVNDFTVFPGVDLAYVKGGLTIQAEATVLQLTRVRGEAVQADAAKTNFTSGLHVGYFVVPQLSVAGELRYQRWLSTPAAVAADTTGATRDNLTFALGVRGHFRLTDSMWIRPGISYARPIDDPMAARGYNIVQIDVPVAF